MPKSGKRNLYSLAAAFLLCGVLKVILYGVDFFDSFSQLFCGVLVALWGLSVQKRVTDRQLQHLLLAVVGFLLLFTSLQICRFSLFEYDTGASLSIDRRLWYACYIPMTALPALCLCIALRVNRQKDAPLPAWVWGICGLGGLLALGVLLNDLHFSFVSFPGGIMTDNGQERHGWMYYVISAYIYITYIGALVILIRKALQRRKQAFFWLPTIPLFIGLCYFVLYPLKLDQNLLGKRIWSMSVMQVFCTIGALESCVQCGLIPANTDYEKLFEPANLSAVIRDSAGSVCYASGCVHAPAVESGQIRIRRSTVPGGCAEQAVDLKRLNEMNREIRETSQKLEARNAYLAEEARVRAELTEVETRNALYDRILSAIQPQVDRVNALLDDREMPFARKIRPLTVMCAYIKRRANMELIAENGTLPTSELALAAAETAEVLRLCEVNTAVLCASDQPLPAELVVAAWEQTERIVEDCLDTLTNFMISISVKDGALTLRVMLTADTLTVPSPNLSPEPRQYVPAVSVTKDGRDMILVFTWQTGGVAV